MSPSKPLMISISGIRGIVGESLTDDVVMRFARAYGRLINGSKIVMGRDTRASGPAIEQLVVDALVDVGYEVVLLGICPTPTVGMSVGMHGADGGIVITASHNPGEWNALKLMNGEGEFLTVEQGERLLAYYEEDSKLDHASEKGSVQTYADACQDHIQRLRPHLPLEQIREEHFKVAFDSVNGAGSWITQEFLEELGCEVTPLHNDPSQGFPRNPEPTEALLGDTCRWVAEQDCDICFVQDPDADRLAIIDSDGTYIGEEMTLALAVEYILSELPKGQAVVANLSSSMILEHIALQYAANAYRSAVGEAHVVAKMHETDAIIGGEGNGGVIYKETHLGRDSLIGMGLVLALLSRSKTNLQTVIQTFPKYCMHKEKMDLAGKDLAAIIKALDKEFSDAERIDIDGVKYLWPDAWVHVRASNTEPIMRVIVESVDRSFQEDLLQRIKSAFERV